MKNKRQSQELASGRTRALTAGGSTERAVGWGLWGGVLNKRQSQELASGRIRALAAGGSTERAVGMGSVGRGAERALNEEQAAIPGTRPW
jgi:hypothetical protein